MNDQQSLNSELQCETEEVDPVTCDESTGLNRPDFLKRIGLGIAATTLAPVMGARLLGKSAGASSTTQGAARWGMFIDLRRCYGCKSCAVACKSEFDVRLGVFMSNVIEYESGSYPKTIRRFLPWMCNHCSDAPCVEVCPVDPEEKIFNGISYKAKATYQRPDGLVLYDRDRCVGCHACVEECPYKARYIEPSLRAGAEPDNQAIGKCTFCAHRMDRGIEPSCVNTCPGNARTFGDLNDSESEISKMIKRFGDSVKPLRPDFGTVPNVFYLDLDEDVYANGVDIRNEAPEFGGQRRV